jgi:hypothetical protein
MRVVNLLQNLDFLDQSIFVSFIEFIFIYHLHRPHYIKFFMFYYTNYAVTTFSLKYHYIPSPIWFPTV